MKRLLVCAATFLLAACGGSGSTGPGSSGALRLGILSGNNQTTTAGSAQLSAPVVGRLVRSPNGTISFIQEAPGRALDLFVPRAFAQGGTVVNGSPVPGAVVCAVSADTLHKLVPFTPCTNTDADGKATFFFTPGTGAGQASAEIRGTVANQPTVFDTAHAIILPSEPIILTQLVSNARDTIVVSSGTSINLHTLIGGGPDKYNNYWPAASTFAPESALVAAFPVPRFALLPADPSKPRLEDLMSDGSATPTGSGWIVTPHAGDARLYIWVGSQPHAIARYFLRVQ